VERRRRWRGGALDRQAAGHGRTATAQRGGVDLGGQASGVVAAAFGSCVGRTIERASSAERPAPLGIRRRDPCAAGSGWSPVRFPAQPVWFPARPCPSGRYWRDPNPFRATGPAGEGQAPAAFQRLCAIGRWLCKHPRSMVVEGLPGRLLAGLEEQSSARLWVQGQPPGCARVQMAGDPWFPPSLSEYVDSAGRALR
jgi:hypothetical protein